jgi:hypothetical protein
MIVLTAAMAIVLYQYFMEIKANVTPGTVGTYGLRNLLRMLNFEQEKPSLLMLLGSFIWITLAISACLYALISGYQFSTQSRKNPSDYRNQSFVFASIIFITTTLVNTNYCYRLIWCVIAISLCHTSPICLFFWRNYVCLLPSEEPFFAAHICDSSGFAFEIDQRKFVRVKRVIKVFIIILIILISSCIGCIVSYRMNLMIDCYL